MITSPSTKDMNSSDYLDAVLLCHAALAQDSEHPPEFYLRQLLSFIEKHCDKQTIKQAHALLNRQDN